MSLFNKILGKPLEPDLLEAIDLNNFEKTYGLLKEGANVNYQGEKGNTPLIRSLNCKDERIFKLLLKYGADINLSTNNGYSPLLFSCMRNDIERVKFFIEKGSNIHQKTKEGWTALILASKILSFFPENSQTDFDAELFNGIIDILHESTNYHRENNPTDCVRLLLKAGADPNISNNFYFTPLMAAAEVVNYQTLEFLLDNKASIKLFDSHRNTALNYAVSTTVEKYYKSILDISLIIGLEQTLGEAVSAPLIASLRPKFEKNQEICVDILIKNDSNIHSIDDKRINILMRATESGNLNVVKKIVAAGADVNYRNVDGLSPIFMAATGGRNLIIKYLLLNGVDIDQEAHNGETPLMTAVWMGHLDTVKLLIKEGANVQCKAITPYNLGGEYPIEWVVKKYRDTNDPRYAEIGQLLLNAGATVPERYR